MKALGSISSPINNVNPIDIFYHMHALPISIRIASLSHHVHAHYILSLRSASIVALSALISKR